MAVFRFTVKLRSEDGDELLKHVLGEIVRGVQVQRDELLQIGVLHPVLRSKQIAFMCYNR